VAIFSTTVHPNVRDSPDIVVYEANQLITLASLPRVVVSEL